MSTRSVRHAALAAEPVIAAAAGRTAAHTRAPGSKTTSTPNCFPRTVASAHHRGRRDSRLAVAGRRTAIGTETVVLGAGTQAHRGRRAVRSPRARRSGVDSSPDLALGLGSGAPSDAAAVAVAEQLTAVDGAHYTEAGTRHRSNLNSGGTDRLEGRQAAVSPPQGSMERHLDAPSAVRRDHGVVGVDGGVHVGEHAGDAKAEDRDARTPAQQTTGAAAKAGYQTQVGVDTPHQEAGRRSHVHRGTSDSAIAGGGDHILQHPIVHYPPAQRSADHRTTRAPIPIPHRQHRSQAGTFHSPYSRPY